MAISCHETDEDGVLKLVQKCGPDFILMDAHMLDISWFSVIKSVFENDPTAKIIIMNGYNDFSCMNQEKIQTNHPGVIAPLETNAAVSQINRSKADKIVLDAIAYIEKNYQLDLNRKIVADNVYVTPTYLGRLFRQELNVTFLDYIHKVRIEKACTLLDDAQLKIYEVALKVGYSDEKYFSRIFKQYTGMTPSQYRKCC